MGEEEIKEAFSGSCSKAQAIGSYYVDKGCETID